MLGSVLEPAIYGNHHKTDPKHLGSKKREKHLSGLQTGVSILSQRASTKTTGAACHSYHLPSHAGEAGHHAFEMAISPQQVSHGAKKEVAN